MKKSLRCVFEKIVRRVDSATGNNLLLAAVNRQLKEFGEMTSIVIDPKNKTIAIEVELKGEEKPITIRIKEYEVEPDGEGSLVKIGDISFSREWMDVIAKKFLANSKLPIPLSSELLGQIL